MDSLDLAQGRKCNVVGDLGVVSIRRPLIVGLNSNSNFTLDAAVTGLRAAILQLNALRLDLCW